MLPLISVIVPVYKVELYIRKCIDSIINQTYQKLEIILVDDSSPDRCPEICDEYALIDNRIKVIHKQNGGLSDARNAGLDIAQGEYIGFVDSDDYIAADMYETLYELIVDAGADISICNYIYQYMDGSQKEYPQSFIGECVINRREALIELLKDNDIQNYACNKLYKAHLFLGIRYPIGRYFEDIFISYLLIMKTENVASTAQAKYYYLQREDSICNAPGAKKVKDRFEAEKVRFEFFESIADTVCAEISLCSLAKNFIAGLHCLMDECLFADQNEWIEYSKKYISQYTFRLFISTKLTFKYKIMVAIFIINSNLYIALRSLVSRILYRRKCYVY